MYCCGETCDVSRKSTDFSQFLQKNECGEYNIELGSISFQLMELELVGIDKNNGAKSGTLVGKKDAFQEAFNQPWRARE